MAAHGFVLNEGLVIREQIDETTAGDTATAITGQAKGNESDDETQSMENMVDKGVEDI